MALAIPYATTYTAVKIRAAITIAARRQRIGILPPPWILKIWILFGTKTTAHDLDGLDTALNTGGKLTIRDGVGEDEIHFLGGPLTLGIARRLPVVVAAVVVAGERVETGRHEGSGSAPFIE